MEGHRALIVGAQGVSGVLTADAFSAAGWDVRRASRRPGQGDLYLDLDDPDSIAAAIRADELVVNTVPHAGLSAERFVLEHGGVLINTSALSAASGRALRAVSGGAPGTVLMNAGLAPGVTTIVAGELLRRHPDAEELELVFTLSSTSPRGPASADFVRRGLITVPRHRTVVVPLPEPFGERVCIGFGEDDAGWLGGIAEGRVVRLYICVTEHAVHERILDLNGRGLMGELPRSLIGPRSVPIDGRPSDEPVAHWIAARRGGRRLAATTVQCRGDFAHAAQSTVVLARALLEQRRRGGCFDPEELFTIGEVQAKLQAVGIAIAALQSSSLIATN
jgi:hypothetical protein